MGTHHEGEAVKTLSFVGYNRNGERVYRAPNGKLFQADSNREALAWVRRHPQRIGLPDEDYLASNGPITKEKS